MIEDLILSFAVVFLAVFAGWIITMVFIGQGVRTTRKTSFDENHNPRCYEGIEFCKVDLKSTFWGTEKECTVWVRPENFQENLITVSLDPSLSKTCLSIVPELSSRIYRFTTSPSIYYAEEVTIWVVSEAEKKRWNRLIERSLVDYILDQEDKRIAERNKKVTKIFENEGG